MWQLQERFQENIYLKRGKRMRKNVGKKKLLLTVLSALALSLAATIGAFADESDTSRLVSGTKINGIGDLHRMRRKVGLKVFMPGSTVFA